MKKFPKLFLATLFFLMLTFIAFADQPPDPGGGPGSGDPPVGGGSSLGGDTIVMIVLSLGYGIRKALSLKEKLLQ
jgi:hypothetical protein